MRKFINILFLLSVLLLISSCAAGYLYYKPLNNDVKIDGDIGLASFQLRKIPVSWSETYGNQIINYRLEFDSPSGFFLTLSKNLDSEIKDRIRVAEIDDSVIKQNQKRNIIESIPYVSMDGLIPVIDEKENPMKMESQTLEILNDYINADYYLVFDGDIIDFEIPSFFNFFEFSLTYEISMVIYDNQGIKVYSQHYSKRYYRIPESFKDEHTYDDYLEKTILIFSDDINNDLAKVLL